MSQMEIERRHDEAEAPIRATVINELCEVMHRTNLPPMAVLRLVARSIGTIYREMADAHATGEPCPCGWRPETDVEVLGMTLMTAFEGRGSANLWHMRVAGSA